MAENEALSQTRQRQLWGLQEQARIKRGNDAAVRACMIGFSVAIAAIAPLTWGWKIALFLAIMVFVGIIIPTIDRARRKSKVSTTGQPRSAWRFADKLLQAANGVRGKLLPRWWAASKSAGD